MLARDGATASQGVRQHGDARLRAGCALAANTTIEAARAGNRQRLVHLVSARPHRVGRGGTPGRVSFEVVIGATTPRRRATAGNTDITFRELWEAVQRAINAHRALGGACDRQSAARWTTRAAASSSAGSGCMACPEFDLRGDFETGRIEP